MNRASRIRNRAHAAIDTFFRWFSGYEAGGTSGRWPRGSTITSPLSQALSARKTVAERAHFLSENSPYVRAIVGNMITSFVGDGPIVRVTNTFWGKIRLLRTKKGKQNQNERLRDEFSEGRGHRFESCRVRQ